MTIAKDTTFAVIHVYSITLSNRLVISVSIEIVILKRDITIVAIFVLIVIAKEVGTVRQYYRLHLLMRDSDMVASRRWVAIVGNKDSGISTKAFCCLIR